MHAELKNKAQIDADGAEPLSPYALQSVYTIESLARALGLSARTVGDAVRAGELRANKRAGKWFILHANVTAWIAAGSSELETAPHKRGQSKGGADA